MLLKKLSLAKNLIIPNFKKIIFNRYINDIYLKGKGLEVGPGENPYATSNKTMYLEKFVANYRDLFPNAKTQNYIEGTAESIPVDDNEFEFIVSAHCLEHCIDTIKVLKEFIRVCKSGAVIVLILPHCERTFDKGRKLSKLDKHVEDFQLSVSDDDCLDESGRHYDIFNEFLNISCIPFNHHWMKDAMNEDDSFNKKWIIENNLLHYHAWTQTEIMDLFNYLGCKILMSFEEMPGRHDSFIVAAEVTK